MATRKIINFEKSMDQLNQLIEKMETAQLPLETALQHFEQGITLIRQCQQTLNEAEQKIQILTEKAGETTLEDFKSHDD
ncbi:MAG: exodeoxyribonuclease VII small subunit [Gammaproteobacteria bacterium RIFCSPHIGHO2_12_FULL_38_11]|nr:MAG: exodeoxyribonuclease VII small subunit [Gammaproteobacteria bacterium RIFCSPHIGHO2_12_FULL_38_11]